MTSRVAHVAISTPDLARAVAFWQQVGFSVIREWSWPAGVDRINTTLGLADSAADAALLRLDGFELELFEFSVPQEPPRTDLRPSQPGYTHIALEVSDLDAELARLSEAGLQRWTDPVRTPGGRRVVYVRDPDGNLVELVERQTIPDGSEVDEADRV